MLQSLLSRFAPRIANRAGVPVALPVALIALGLAGTGCTNDNTGSRVKSFLDPSQVGFDANSGKVVNIVDNLAVGEDEDVVSFGNARDVTAADLVNDATDYKISPNDLLQVTLSDLAGPGSEQVKTVRVSQTGQIVLPLLVKPVQATGLSEAQVQQAVVDAYKDADVVRNATISVSVLEARGRTYTVSGAVNAESPYYINDNDFRLLDALVAARGVNAPIGIDTIYVIRRTETGGPTAPAARPAAPGAADPLAPQSGIDPKANLNTDRDPMPRRGAMLKQDPMAPSGAPAGSVVTVEGQDVTLTQPPSATNPATQPAAMTDTTTGAAAGTGGTAAPAAGNFEFNSLAEPGDREVIRVPFAKLRAGQLKYNIVIKPGDTILVPPALQGVYYMGGNILAPGAYSIPPTKITLSSAVVSARGLNEVAWPARTELVRRLPGDRQVFVKVDLNKIFAGQEPDIYLKPDDRVNVGTDLIAPFLASLRNGFRVTYGFGFLYDRNYAPDRNNNN